MKLNRRAFLKQVLGGSLAAAGWVLVGCNATPASTQPAMAAGQTATPGPISAAPTAALATNTGPATTPSPVALATQGATAAGLTAKPPVLAESERALRQVSEVQQVGRIVGQGLAGEHMFNDTPKRWGVYGADLGHMFDAGDRLYMVFGDSFGCCIPGTGGPGNAGDWRPNLMAVIANPDPVRGPVFADMISDRPGHATQLIRRSKFDVTVIPTNGIAAGVRLYLHYMGVMAWGDPGKWALNEAGLAYSDDRGQTWTRDGKAKWDGKSNFGQVAFARLENDIYLFGIPGGRFGGVKLARVKEDELLDIDAYRYYSGSQGGQPTWSTDESAAALIVPAPVGELSVMWNAYLTRWIMTYLDEGQAALVIREAAQPWGPWSPSQSLVSGSAYPALYAPYMHPRYVERDGEIIYFTMSQWGPYAVYWMKARLLRA